VRSYPRATSEAWTALACAGLTVAPTVAALIVSAAEMAMRVRFTEDPNMFQLPFLTVRFFPRLLPVPIHEVCQAR
jgi:hypothetical protein